MQKILLNGEWTLSGGGFFCRGEIPGSVYSFLLKNHLMKDPHFGLNELEAEKLLEHDYTFSRSFTYKKDSARVSAVFECLDTLCTVSLNGKTVLKANNMHRTYEVDVTKELEDGENKIELLFSSPIRFMEEADKKEHVPGTGDAIFGFSHLRKAHCMMGWDWGPRLPDAGVGRDLYLLKHDSERITDFMISQRHENGRVFVTPKVETTGNAEAVVTVIAPNGEAFRLPANCESEIENPQLWWPNGLGEQPLYTFKAELLENGRVQDTAEKRIGLRTLKLIREKDVYGESFCHECNGVRFFAMGGDYIPEDNIRARITKERTKTLLTQCRDCNFNAVRVWGGGFYPDDFFFDACDELGLVVFLDMMFACTLLPTTEEFKENFLLEARDNLKRIRHHASIAVICGNNEIEMCFGWVEEQRYKDFYTQVFEGELPKLVKEICPDLPYISSSPTTCGHFIDPNNENYGDCHYWAVWHGNKPFSEYRNHYFRYLSEFGFEAFPSEKTVNAFTNPEDRNIFSRVLEMHQRCIGGNKKILTYLADTYRYPEDFGTLLYYSGLLQATAIRYGVEHLRRNRGRCMGALYWQINDIWPTASWASIDYFGRFKPLQYAAKRFFAPVMISCRETGEHTTRDAVTRQLKQYDYETKAQLSVNNDTRSEVRGTVRWALRNNKAEILKEGAENVTIAPMSVLTLDEMDFQKTDVLNNYLSFCFCLENGEILSEGTCLFTLPKYFNFAEPHLKFTVNGDEITVSADAYAASVEIDSPDSDFILSDNYFDLNAGSKTVKILSGNPKTLRLRGVKPPLVQEIN